MNWAGGRTEETEGVAEASNVVEHCRPSCTERRLTLHRRDLRQSLQHLFDPVFRREGTTGHSADLPAAFAGGVHELSSIRYTARKPLSVSSNVCNNDDDQGIVMSDNKHFKRSLTL